MIQITEIEIINFKTIKHLKTKLPLNCCISVNADNRDEIGSNSNKGGKSNFIKAINWCLFGVSQIEGTNDEIIRYGEKNCSVKLWFNNNSFIIRELRNKTQNFVYNKNNVDVATSNKEMEEKFLEDMNIISKEIVKNGIYLNSVSGTIVEVTPKQRLDIFTEWFNLSKWDEYIKTTRDILNKNKSELIVLQAVESVSQEDIDNTMAEIHNIEEQIAEKEIKLNNLEKLQQNFNNQVQIIEQINILKKYVDEKTLINTEAEKAKKELINMSSLADIELKQQNIEKALNKLGEEYSVLSLEYNKAKQDVKKAQSNIGNPSVCPSCNASLIYKDNELKLYDNEIAENNLKQAQENQIKINTAMTNKSEEIHTTKTASQQCEENRRKINKLNEVASKYVSVSSDIDNLKNLESKIKDIVDYTNEIREFKTEINKLYSAQGQRKTYLDYLYEKKEKHKNAQNDMIRINETINMCIKWGGEKQKIGWFHKIKQLVLFKNINNLEAITNNTLNSLFNIDTVIKLEITDKGIELYQNNDKAKESMSSGERARVSFALAYALSRLYPTNMGLLSIDEFFSNLDQTGMEKTINVLNKIDGQKFIVSHVFVETNEEIKLVKQNGITSLAE